VGFHVRAEQKLLVVCCRAAVTGVTQHVLFQPSLLACRCALHGCFTPCCDTCGRIFLVWTSVHSLLASVLWCLEWLTGGCS
jgi:hypothetical protein